VEVVGVVGAGASAAPFCQLPAVAFLRASGAIQAAAGPVAVGAVEVGLLAVVAVAAPAGQALERSLGGLPVTAAARA
jgi:hypothetical protein